VTVYREGLGPFAGDCDLVDGLVAVGDSAEKDFAGLEFQRIFGGGFEHARQYVLRTVTEDLYRGYCPCALARH
jgi:hypothetical protein